MLQMESERKEKMMKNNSKKKKNEKQRNFSERSPLQELERLPRNGSNSNSHTRIPSSSTSVSVEAPRGCLRFLLSANSNSCSSSSGSRKHQCRRKPESFSKPISSTPSSAPNLTRLRSRPSKENDLPRVVTSRKPKKNSPFLSQWQSGKKSCLKTTEASSNFTISVKNSASGSEGFGANRKDLKQENTCCSASSGQPTELFSFKVSDNLNSIENCTPLGKLSCWSALDSSVFDDKQPVGGDSNSTSTTKTPPVEASVSPEIQSGVSNLFGSAATPVCYGVGHLLSGVTDKRKCRPRGILTIGVGDVDGSSSACEETNVCADDHGNGRIATEILAKSRPSFIPLPTEASMRWLSSSSSPQGENHQKSDSSDQCMTLLSSSSFSLPFSPSNCFPSDLVSDSEDIYDSSSNFDPTTTTSSTGKTRIVLLSPIRTPNSHGFSGSLPKTMDIPLLSASPQSKSSHDINCLPKEGNFSDRSIGDYSTLGERSPTSTGFFSSGNVVQTPTSVSSSGRLVNVVQTDADDKQTHEHFDDLQIDSVAESLDRTSLSPIIHTMKWDPPGLSPLVTDFKHLSSCASWVSDSTLQNVSLSQMRISWREGLASQILDADELDCCRCLSDEEKEEEEEDIGYPDNKLSSPKTFDESISSEPPKTPFENDGPNSPEFLDQEPMISGKDKLSAAQHNACGAESMSIDAGGLVSSSGDSDWTVCYKNHLFEV